MHDEEALRRGARAKALLEDPMLEEAFAAIKAACLKQWEDAPARDVDGRERLWLMVKLVDRLKGHFEAVLADGRIAEANLAEIDRQSRFRKLFG